ncbi:MAG: carbohydrate binding family 9 domain-containing protein [Candidatus Zixiibacteriota bacterium]|nr:MAG: carbohydrate binding family 9 domain-containing protein [candidate division Zixibacteria bacterium]
MDNIKGRLLLLALVIIALTSSDAFAEITAEPLKTLDVQRVSNSPRIDGVLFEDDWAHAAVMADFRQTSPDEGEAASESTLVAVLYDDEALYIGIMCFDGEPDRIIRQLTRRDRVTESDRVAVMIDSRHDHQTAYYFSVNAAGVLRDMLIYDNDCYDDTWDGIWEAEAVLAWWGWSAEFKIPYSTLRFNKADEMVWGIDFTRYIPRKNESSRWQFVPQHETEGVSRYGHMAGIDGIEPPGRLETQPYFVSSGTARAKEIGNNSGGNFMSNVGVDFKYGISHSVTLDAAINPDFGQVESDRSVINLTAYELFFEEKRPFFVEGSEIFRNPHVRQFYSRRIGRKPTGEVDEAENLLDDPQNTTLLAALKLTGKTSSGTAFGVLNTMTQEEKVRYTVAGDAEPREAVVEPLANYTVARVKQDIFGSSYVGGMVTAANQRERDDAYTASADWKLYFLNHKFNFGGTVIGTNNGPGTADMAAKLSLAKAGGRIIRGSINAGHYGRQVDWNRLGFLNRNSIRETSAWVQFYSNKNFSIFRYMNLNFNGWYNENLDGYRLVNGGNVNGQVQFKNNWSVWAGLGLDGSRYDDRETRGNGLWYIRSNDRHWIGFCTNSARKVQFELNYHHDNEKDGLFYLYELWANFKPATNFEFSLGTEYNINRDVDFWVGTGEDGLPVFGKLDNDNVDINCRGTYTFTKRLTLQWFTQFYFSTGEYDRFRELIAADNLQDVKDGYEIDFARNDFNFKSANINLILRWEYMPGSALYLVWTQARESWISDNGDFNIGRDFQDLINMPNTNTFLVKVNYWWNI